MSIYDDFQDSQGMTLDEFITAWGCSLDRALSADLRAGQHAMNLLWFVRPDLYRYVAQWYGVDCFYVDDFLPRFWEEVAAKW